MIKSMTGFGKAEAEHKGKKINIEIKSLNSKNFNFNPQIPQEYRNKALDLRNEILKKLSRGNIELYIGVTLPENHSEAILNRGMIKKFYQDIMDISEELGITPNSGNVMQGLINIPDAYKTHPEEVSEKEWNKVFSAVQKAAGDVIAYRMQEGTSIQEDLTRQIDRIKKYVNEIEPYEKSRIAQVREKLNKRMKELDNSEVDKNRYEEEVLYYAEKLDINEEKTRLLNHCDYFLKTMEDHEVMGKKLNFISQEINREINTLGAKAYETNIQQIVVNMKDDLEKIKEQIMNVL